MKGKIEKQNFLVKGKGDTFCYCVEHVAVRDIKMYKPVFCC